MDTRKLLSLVRKACEDFNMIQENETIAVGVSGGKDSLVLLYALKELSKFYPKKFQVIGVTVDLGFQGFDCSKVKDFCEQLEVPYYILPTNIEEIVFQIRKEKNPCSLCSKMKKGVINEFILKHQCHKLALGHNMDDLLETLLMSLFYEGRIFTFPPVSYLDRKNIYQIRPLIYVKENDIKKFAYKNNFPVTPSLCPVDGATKREDIKKLIKNLGDNYENLEKKLMNAILNSHIQGYQKE